MAFSPQFLDELRARVALSAVVGRRVKLVRKGREYQGLCPFHNEKSPSFTVNEEKGFFHCFGCGAHGDIIGFEMRAHHMSFPEAVEKLAAEAGLDVPKATPEERIREERRASLHDAMEAACAFYEKQLRQPAGREGLAYLRERGLSEETIARFRLGWAPEGREALKSTLMCGTLPESLLIEAGLLKKPEGGGASFDFFRGRVMFPITDRRGRVIAFGARTLGDGQPKYLNSTDTPLFHKGATLYGLAHAREAARAQGRLVAVEGYMDVIALHQAGFPHAVAPLGTALTEQQIEEMWRLAPEPVLCLDGDAAGQRAMARAAERCLPILKPGHSLGFAVLPAPEDPDSLIKSRGAAAMRAVLDAPRPLIEVVWELTTQGRALDTPERRAALEKDLADKAFAIADKTVQQQYLRAFKDKMWQAFRPPRPAPGAGVRQGGGFGQGGGVRRDFRKPGQPPLRGPDGRLLGSPRPPPPAASQDGTWYAQCERALLTLVLHHPALVGEVGELMGEHQFTDMALDRLRRGILKHLTVAPDLDSAGLSDHLRSDGFIRELDSLLDADEHRIGRPDSAFEARVHWDHLFKRYLWRRGLRADVDHAVQRLADDMSAEALERFEALKGFERALDDDD